jgi:hypothetical protein
MRFTKIKVGITAAALVGTLGFWSMAGAQSADNPTNQAVKVDDSRGAPATSAGMPLTGQVLAAVVNGTAVPAALVAVQSVGAVNVIDVGIGTYDVRFVQTVADCTFLATIGIPGSAGISPPGEITVVGRAGAPNGVLVQTYNSAGSLVDRSFHLGVIC